MLDKTRDLKEVGYRRKNKSEKKIENKEKKILFSEIKNKHTNKQKYECETI